MGRILLCLLLALTAAQLRQREDASRRRPPSKPPLLRVLPPGNSVALAAGTLTGSKGETLTTTRASTKTCINAAGNLVTLSSNQPCVETAGLLVEPAATNPALWNRDWTNAAWTLSSITAVKTATGVDSITNSASTLTATGSNGTALQALTIASATRATSLFMRRRTGAGTVSVTRNGGSTWLDVTSLLSSSWLRLTPTNVAGLSSTLTNPSLGVKLAANTDAVDVDLVQDEVGSVATSPIATTTTTTTRVADVVSASNLVLGSTPSIGATAVLNGPANDSILVQAYDSVSNSRLQMYAQFVDSKIQCSGTSGGVSQGFVISAAAVVVGTPFRVSCTYTGSKYTICLNGTCNSSGTVSGPGATTFPKLNMGNSTTFALGMLTGHLQSICANNRGNSCL